MRDLWTILLLTAGQVLLTLGWFGHLRFKIQPVLAQPGPMGVGLVRWDIAFFEYGLQVPTNLLRPVGQGGPFGWVRFKGIQEVTALTVFAGSALLTFKRLRWNLLLVGVFLIVAVRRVFKD